MYLVVDGQLDHTQKCSHLIPGSTHGSTLAILETIYNARVQTRLSCMQGKNLNPCICILYFEL